jgi:hypothetical protein
MAHSSTGTGGASGGGTGKAGPVGASVNVRLALDESG